MAGNLNAKLAETEGTPRGEAISDDLVAAGPMDMGVKFLPQNNPWFEDRCTWRMQRDGQVFRYWADYILGTDCRLFQDMDVWYM